MAKGMEVGRMSREQCALKKIMVQNSLHAVKAKPSTERKRWSRPWQRRTLVSERSWTDFNGALPSCSRQDRCCCSFKPQLNVKVSLFFANDFEKSVALGEISECHSTTSATNIPSVSRRHFACVSCKSVL